MVHISHPRIIQEPDVVKVAADIEYDGETKTLWYGVSPEYAQYLTPERADCFLVAMIPSIARRGGQAVVEGLVSSHLKFKLEEVLSPLLPLVRETWSPLHIEAQTAGPLNEKPAGVGAGCSCGIDSLFTIHRFTQPTTPDDWKITHLLYLKAGAHRHTHLGEQAAKRERYLAEGRLANARGFAERVGLPLLYMETNLGDFFDGYEHQSIHSFLSMSCVLALQKLLGIYHFSSGMHAREDAFDPDDSAPYDVRLVECLSTENTRFYSDGYEQTRYGKTKVVAEYAPAHDFLNVCIYEVQNCTRCPKCLRTISQLEMLGKLPLFQRVFDLDFYRAHRIQFLGEGIYRCSGYYLAEMLEELPHSCLSEKDKSLIRRDYRWRRLRENAWLSWGFSLARRVVSLLKR